MECTIIGGGIQGLSTGLLLEHLGHETTILTSDLAYIDGDDIPTVATDYAAASIYPVAVETEYEEDQLIQRCRNTFTPFFERDNVPVRKHTHYYVYESEADFDGRVPDRMSAKPVSEYNGEIPSRDDKDVTSGYVCEEYFVEMPEYIPALYETYLDIGGSIGHQTVESNRVTSLPGEYVFNCSGYGSRSLFDDESMRAIKGHILQIPYDGDAPLPFSYTYTAEEYGHYTYMYPRKDTILFGGSYLEGDIVDGTWSGESPMSPMRLDDKEIPERIVTVNADIIDEYVEFEKSDISVKYGYRPYRSDGVRLERDGRVIHNYGHGGAGVSMSWWSAQQAINHIDTVSQSDLEEVADRIHQQQAPSVTNQ